MFAEILNTGERGRERPRVVEIINWRTATTRLVVSRLTCVRPLVEILCGNGGHTPTRSASVGAGVGPDFSVEFSATG